MNDLGSRILLETVKVGSLDEPGVSFSTKAIASVLEIKEADIFALYPTKKDLLEAAEKEVYENQMVYLASLIEAHPAYSDWIDGVLDYFLAHSDEVFFLINYLPGLAKASLDNASLAVYHERTVFWGKKILCFFRLGDDEEYFFLWSSIYRSLLYAAANILRGEAEPTTDTRALLKRLLHSGLDSYFAKEVS